MGPDYVAMIALPGGTFTMGSVAHYPEEAPLRQRTVEAFEIDQHPVTVRQFARFVRDTGYRTVAERPLDAPEYSHLPDAERIPGGLVFTPTAGPVSLDDWRQWWRWVPGASWRQPYGPRIGRSSPGGPPGGAGEFRGHVSAYAAWAEAAAERGGARVRLPRGSGGRDLRVGRGTPPGRLADGEHVAGTVPVREHRVLPAGSARRRSEPSRPTRTAWST